MSKQYRSTVAACYTANFIGALVIHLTPILFVPLKLIYGLSYTQFGILLAVNYCTQVGSDFLFSFLIDRYGSRRFAILAPVLTAAGYLIFLLSPEFLNDPFPGFLAGTILFSATGGILEVVLNVIINGIPGEEKSTLISVLHSFYGWGTLAVVLTTTLALWIFGTANWQFIMAAWIALPLFNTWQFCRCPIPANVAECERMGAAALLKFKEFYLVIALITVGGMTEVTITLWLSPFLERAANIPKVIGDTAGVCLAAAMLGAGRLLYGIYGAKIDVWKLMLPGTLLAALSCIAAAVTPFPALSLAGCVLATLGASLLWPGSVVLATRQFPLAGAWLFAMLALGGDLGAALGPYLTGIAADHADKIPFLTELRNSTALSTEQFNLRTAMCLTALFPLLTAVMLLIFNCVRVRSTANTSA